MSFTHENKAHTRFLLIGPYDPHGGEYTFLAPPLGVWRLAGVLESAGHLVTVFDPNCCEGPPAEALKRQLHAARWDVVGVSTTGMTLRYDLELAAIARTGAPLALLVAGGMEATFKPELMFRLAPFDLIVLGEGEKPLLELARRRVAGESLAMIPGTATAAPGGGVNRYTQHALTPAELADAIKKTPYEKMPYEEYWQRLETAYRVRALPSKADREARLAEIRSVRLITLNYCPMGCTFCSSTNYLHEAQGSVASIARLDVGECMQMLKKIVVAHPGVRTVIFQDDIFAFTKDQRILPLCAAIVAAKAIGELPRGLQFISTNRIDAMTSERLAAMHSAGFRVLGFGIESFSHAVLEEFNKKHIYRFIEPVLTEARALGITPFLDLILTSPRGSLADFAETIRQAYRWITAGCEVGMYPYVIPFSGAAMSNDPALKPHTISVRHHVARTAIAWEQPAKILPIDPAAREAVLAVEADFERWLAELEHAGYHLPSRVRSLMWIVSAIPHLLRAGEAMPDRNQVLRDLAMRLPGVDVAPRGGAYADARARDAAAVANG